MMFENLFKTLDFEFRTGGIDPRSYAAIRAELMCEKQRFEACQIPKALDLYNAVKAVIDV